MCMKMVTFNFTAYSVPGQELIVPGALLRAPFSPPWKVDMAAELEIITHVNAKMNNLPDSDDMISNIMEKTNRGKILVDVCSYIEKGQPNSKI